MRPTSRVPDKAPEHGFPDADPESLTNCSDFIPVYSTSGYFKPQFLSPFVLTALFITKIQLLTHPMTAETRIYVVDKAVNIHLTVLYRASGPAVYPS